MADMTPEEHACLVIIAQALDKLTKLRPQAMFDREHPIHFQCDMVYSLEPDGEHVLIHNSKLYQPPEVFDAVKKEKRDRSLN